MLYFEARVKYASVLAKMTHGPLCRFPEFQATIVKASPVVEIKRVVINVVHLCYTLVQQTIRHMKCDASIFAQKRLSRFLSRIHSGQPPSCTWQAHSALPPSGSSALVRMRELPGRWE
mmetsp:Transcript_4711/g.9366  ORF Transcript_4711/g.9366 Transcript_4711/m.9366 type:complete len:118 (-) Transcript_4711:103-456(-)